MESVLDSLFSYLIPLQAELEWPTLNSSCILSLYCILIPFFTSVWASFCKVILSWQYAIIFLLTELLRDLLAHNLL